MINKFFAGLTHPAFTRYALFLFRRRFQCVWLDNTGYPPDGNSVLFIGNHNSWWDGLVPVLLNEKIFRLENHTMLDEELIGRQSLYRRFNTLALKREHPRKALKSLEYAARLLNEAPAGKGVGLWVYPEGRVTSPDHPIRLENGLVWLIRRIDLTRCDIIPFATNMHTMRSRKPELFIKIGNPIGPSITHSGDMLTKTTHLLEDLRHICREQSTDFDEDGRPKRRFRELIGRNPG